MGEEKKLPNNVNDYLKELELLGKSRLVLEKRGKILEESYNKFAELIEKYRSDKWEIIKLFDRVSVTPMSPTEDVWGRKISTLQDRVMGIITKIVETSRATFMALYDFKKSLSLYIQIKTYEEEKDTIKKEAALQRLKQYWTTFVDMKESGAASLNALAMKGMPQVRSGFFAVKDEKELEEKLGDLNEQTKRIIKAKLRQFWTWYELTKEEIPARLNYLKSWLKSAVNAIKTYVEWIKPFLYLIKVSKFYRHDFPEVLSYLDQTVTQSGFLFIKEAHEKIFLCAKVTITEIGRVKPVNVPPAGQSVVHYGKLIINIEGYIADEKHKEELKEVAKKEDEAVIEEVLGKSYEDVVKEVEKYLEIYEKKLEEYIKKGLDIEAGKEGEKKEEEKKSLKEKLKEETEFIGYIIELIEKLRKKEKKEEKKEEEKKLEEKEPEKIHRKKSMEKLIDLINDMKKHLMEGTLVW